MNPRDQEQRFFAGGTEGLPPLMAQCPLCQGRYQSSEARVIADRDDACLLVVPCPQCRASVVALVYMNAMGGPSIGVLADLCGDEVLTLRHEGISADDVLDFSDALQSTSLLQLLESI